MRTRSQAKRLTRGIYLKKFIVIVAIIVFLLLFGYFIYLYVHILNVKEAGYDTTREKVFKETNVKTISKIKNFNGDIPYHVVYGTTKEDKKRILFVPLKDEEAIQAIDQTNIVSEKSIQKDISDSCSSCNIIKQTPAILNDQFLWETIYIDELNRFVFDYRTLDTGRPYEVFKLTSIYEK